LLKADVLYFYLRFAQIWCQSEEGQLSYSDAMYYLHQSILRLN